MLLYFKYKKFNKNKIAWTNVLRFPSTLWQLSLLFDRKIRIRFTTGTYFWSESGTKIRNTANKKMRSWASVKELNSVEIFRHWSSMRGRCSRRCPPHSQPIETWLRTSGWGQIQKKSGRIRSLSQSSSELQVRIPILDFLNQP